jgi:tetratricopeptide (TPR) repeat protein
MNETLPSLRVVRGSIPIEVEQAVQKALAKIPADRFRTAADFAEALTSLHISARSDPSLRRIWVRRGTLGLAGVVVALAAVAAVTVLVLRGGGQHLVDNRVLVAVLTNDTGDPALDPVGRIAADLLARGLQETRLVEVVDPRVALSWSAVEEPGDPARRLAERVGAGTFISGAYFRLGDSLRFQAQLTETKSGKLLQALDPVSSLVDDPMSAMQMLTQSVMVSVSALFSPELAELGQVVRRPTSYSAYRQYVTGLGLLYRGDYEGAIGHLEQALAEDSAFAIAALYAAAIYATSGYPGPADAVVSSLSGVRERLTEAEGHVLNWLQAWLEGDRVGAYQAIRQAWQLAPMSPEFVYTAGREAIDINRPGEGLEIVRTADPRDGFFSGNPEVLWEELVEAHHMLGEHQAELAVARRGRAQFPGRLWALDYEAVALAALGRVEDLRRLVDESLTFPTGPNLTPAGVMRHAALELQAHGHADSGNELVDQAIEWYRERPDRWRAAFAVTIYRSGHWKEARDSFRLLAAEFPDSLDFLGFLGVTAARLNDREAVVRIGRQLAAMSHPYLWGAHTLWKARIAAVLGERDTAVNLLRDAFDQGLAYGDWLHREFDFMSLREYLPYQQLLRPKG